MVRLIGRGDFFLPNSFDKQTTMKKEATLYLPSNGKELWTKLMEGTSEVSKDIYENQPIVMATAIFEDGISVAGGVYKSSEPEFYNIKFYYVFDKDGNHLPFRIDPSDNEDFRESARIFYLNDEDVGNQYYLNIVERKISGLEEEEG